MPGGFCVSEIVNATGGASVRSFADDIYIPGVSTDTRTLKSGEAFFALAGENHDAHDHLDEAAARGAALLVVSDLSRVPDSYTGRLATVSDTLYAYQELAAYYRRKINPFVIAVTGSVGKTTLKDMIACIMNDHVKAAWTKGNLNNQIGLPRTILEADEDTDALILEMGMDRAGQIERLAEIARPNVAAITNIGGSHRENFDSDDGILKAKYEIAAFLGEGDALVIDAGQCAELTGMAETGSREKGFCLVEVAAAGSSASCGADFVYTPVRTDGSADGISLFEAEGAGGAASFAVPVPGAYVSLSAALASAVCARTGVPISGAAAALAHLERTKHRLETIRKDGIVVIDDTYNASPDSAKIGLDYLKIIQAKRRFAVLADMNELGADSEKLHMEVGAAAVLAGADRIYTFGAKAGKIADGAEMNAGSRGAEVFRFGSDEKAALIEALRGSLREGDAVYVKGSRSMKMEEVVSALIEV